MMTWPAAVRAELFYDQRFEAGKAALSAKRNVEAAEQFRIAAFGYLDDPPRLTQALALLTIAEAALGRTAEVQAALGRFLEVESRFATWQSAAIEPAPRAQFESILLQSVPKPVLAGIPTLASLVAPPARPATSRPKPQVQQPAQQAAAPTQMAPARSEPAKSGPPPQTSSATQPATPPVTVTKTPPAATTATSTQPPATATRPSTQQPKTPPVTNQATTSTAPAQAPPKPKAAEPVPSAAGTQSLEEGKKLIAARRFADAATLLTSAVAREGSRRDLRLALLQAAALSANWRLAAAQVSVVQPFSDNEAAAMFYGALALFETGRVEEARTLLNRALPRITRSPYVDHHANRILGRTSS